MSKLYKRAFLKFTAYKEFDCPQDEDLSAQLKTFCDDNDIEFANVIEIDKVYECPLCGKFASKIESFEDSKGNDVDCCKECFDNWDESSIDDEDQHRGDR